ncbi:MAG: M20/M25/M40 family metallo-hydrolase [Firmicutes bacterium]|nr:M20/M25/M40 family metallo-hydrolase [Bacillota bacterium]
MEQQLAEMLARMIRLETVSAHGQTDLTKFYAFHDLLRELFPHLFAVCDFEEFEGSFLLRWPGAKPGQGLLLMNHHDVVAASGNWQYPPFSGEIAEGKVWGRGTLDDKGPLFGMLKAADDLAAEGFTPARDIYFESACTEEIAGSGAEHFAAELKKRGLTFDLVLDEGGMILTEPIKGAKGDYAMIGVGEKGCADLKFTARSGGGHASAPPKNTPLVRLGRFMAAVDRSEPVEVKLSPAIIEMLRRLAPTMSGLTAKLLTAPEKYRFPLTKILNASSPTAAAMLKTTVAFTRASGSNGNNVIPDEAYVVGNMRFSHHQGREKSFQAIARIAKRYGLEMEILDPGVESPLSDWNSPEFRLIEEAVREVFPGVRTSPYVMTGGSDSRYMSIVSDTCLRFAPFHISDKQLASIHGLDECVDVASLPLAVKFYKYVIRRF